MCTWIFSFRSAAVGAHDASRGRHISPHMACSTDRPPLSRAIYCVCAVEATTLVPLLAVPGDGDLGRYLEVQGAPFSSGRFCQRCACRCPGKLSCAELRAYCAAVPGHMLVASARLAVAGRGFDPRIFGLWAQRPSHCATSQKSNRSTHSCYWVRGGSAARRRDRGRRRGHIHAQPSSQRTLRFAGRHVLS